MDHAAPWYSYTVSQKRDKVFYKLTYFKPFTVYLNMIMFNVFVTTASLLSINNALIEQNFSDSS